MRCRRGVVGWRRQDPSIAYRLPTPPRRTGSYGETLTPTIGTEDGLLTLGVVFTKV